jgi:hypothetical protein
MPRPSALNYASKFIIWSSNVRILAFVDVTVCFHNIMVVRFFRVPMRPEALIAVVAPTSHVSP